MDKLRAWIYGGQKAKYEQTTNETTQESFNKVDSPNPASTPALEIDPKVEEFFKDFPEPYRQKVVQHYSKREGFNKWDFLRDKAMADEMEHAYKGIFLQDRREEELQRQRQDLEKQEKDREREKQFHERPIPKWEKQVLKVIPLQSWDTMPWKLFQTILFSVTGFSYPILAVCHLKRCSLPKWRAYQLMMTATGLCGCSQITALYRLMDWGPFDRSVEDIDWREKVMNEINSGISDVNTFLEILQK